MSNMFKCFVDCADLDLVNDCTATDSAERRYPQAEQRNSGDMRQQGSAGLSASARRAEEQQQKEEEDEEEEEDPAYDEGEIDSMEDEGSIEDDRSQLEYSLDDAPDAGERTGEQHPEDLENIAAARQVADPPSPAQEQNRLDSPASRESKPSLENTVNQAAASAATATAAAAAARYGAPPLPPSAPAGAPEGNSASAAEAAASEAAAEGMRASTGAADAVAAAAAAADAGSQEEAEAAADRAAKAAAMAASSAANALKAAQEAGKAAAAEQAVVDGTAKRGLGMSRVAPSSGATLPTPKAVVTPTTPGVEAEAPGASYEANDPTPEEASPLPGQMEAAPVAGGAEFDSRKPVRSASMSDSGDQDTEDVTGKMPVRVNESMFRSVPGPVEIREAQTPGRLSEGDRTRVMARRLQSDWAQQDAEAKAPPRPRTLVSTRLRYLRLSPDGTTLVVKSEKGGIDHELALDELLEVHETPSEESVTLMGKDIEIRIAFKGQAKALKQFRTMLVPAGSGAGSTSGSSPSSTSASGIGNPSGTNTIATIQEESPDIEGSSDDRSVSVVPGSIPENSSENGSGNGYIEPVPVPGSAAPVAERYEAPPPATTYGAETHDRDSAPETVTRSPRGNDEAGTVDRKLPPTDQTPLGGQQQHLAGSYGGGSTFADARERERVIAELQSENNTMFPVEREAKLHLVKYEQAGFVRGYEALCDQQQVRLRKRPEFAHLETIGVAEGLADPSIVLKQPSGSTSVEVHHDDAVRAKEALDQLMEKVSREIQGLWVKPVPVKEESAITTKAQNDYDGDVRRVLDVARTSVICETPELLRQVVDRLRTHPDVRRVGRVKNSFGETAVGKGGYRDIKVNLEPLVVAHFVEVQVHLREFYELNSRSHEVYEWARGVDLPEGTTPHLLFRNLSPEVQAEMTRLVKEDWMGLRRILPELLQATEQYGEAEPLLRQNVEDAEKRWVAAKENFGEGHLHEMTCAQGVAMALNNLALALKGRGDTAGAEPLLRRALEMSEDSQGSEHPEVATRLNSLALLLASDGRVEEAENLHRRALDIARKVYGPEHADVATYLNNLARVLKAQDKLQEAEPLQRSALSIGERMLGTNHSDVATYYNNLSRLVRAAGKLEEAEPLQRRAVEIGEQVLGPNSPDLATWVNNLGRLLMARKKLAEAEEVQERAVAIAENVYGPDHPQVARARKNLTKVRWALGRTARTRGSASSNRAFEA